MIGETYLTQRDSALAEHIFRPFGHYVAQYARIRLGHKGLKRVHQGPGQAPRPVDGIDGSHIVGRIVGHYHPHGIPRFPFVSVRVCGVIQPGHHHRKKVEPFPELCHVDVPADHDGLRGTCRGGHVDEKHQRRVRYIRIVDRNPVETDYPGFGSALHVTGLRIADAVVSEETVGLSGTEMRQGVKKRPVGALVRRPGDQGEVRKAFLGGIAHEIVFKPVGEGAVFYLIGGPKRRHLLSGQEKSGQKKRKA